MRVFVVVVEVRAVGKVIALLSRCVYSAARALSYGVAVSHGLMQLPVSHILFLLRSLRRLVRNCSSVASLDRSCRETTTSRVGFTMLRSRGCLLCDGGVVASEDRSCSDASLFTMVFGVRSLLTRLLGNGGVIASENRSCGAATLGAMVSGVSSSLTCLFGNGDVVASEDRRG